MKTNLPTCFLDLPEDLENPTSSFLVKTFLAEVSYDYIIIKEIPLEIRVQNTDVPQDTPVPNASVVS